MGGEGRTRRSCRSDFLLLSLLFYRVINEYSVSTKTADSQWFMLTFRRLS